MVGYMLDIFALITTVELKHRPLGVHRPPIVNNSNTQTQQNTCTLHLITVMFVSRAYLC
jgi:hypothetical protein